MSKTTPISIHFGLGNCSLEIENAIITHLMNDKTHPEASPRFGTHFLAFPFYTLTSTSDRNGKLLYILAFQTKLPSLIYENVAPLSRGCLIFTNCGICWQDGVHEIDDPRSIFTFDTANLDDMPKPFSATGFEMNSPELYVRFEEGGPGQKVMAGMFNRTVQEGDDGLENGEFPLLLQIISSGWFDKTGHPPPPRATEGWGSKPSGRTVQENAYDRHGYKSAVPVPKRPDGLSYDIALPPIFHPEWATSGKPEAKRYDDIRIWDERWRITYRTELNGFEDHDDDEDLRILMAMAREELEEMNEQNGFVSIPTRVDLELVRIPLLDLLRPPIALETPYYEDW